MEDEINKDFSSMPELFSQTLNKLMNTFKKRLNEFNNEGKGLGRIVKLFQDFEKWLDSDKGKETIDKLMNVFDKFIDFLTKIASTIGKILDSPVGDFLLGGIEKYLSIKPYMMLGDIFLGKTDRYGNQRAGLLGYGGVFNILTRLFQTENPLTALFGRENINGIPMAVGGLIPNLLMMIPNALKALKVLDGNWGSAFEQQINLQANILELLKNSSDVRNAKSIMTMLGGDVDQKWLDKLFRDNDLINEIETKKGMVDHYEPTTKGEVADLLLNNGVFKHIAGTAVGQAGAGVLGKLGNALASGGLLSKTGLAGVITNPIVLAIGALGAGIVARNIADKKADEKDRADFLAHLPNLDAFTHLDDTDRKYIEDYALNWYGQHTSGKFIGVNRDWGDYENRQLTNQILNIAIERNEAHIKNIEKATSAISENTASQLDITDDFIRNMRDIRTRSFRAELLAGGTSNNDYNIVVNMRGTSREEATEVAQIIVDKIAQASASNLNAPVVV